jgi:hypothetical protein
VFTTLTAIVFTLVLVVGIPALSYSTARNSEIRKLPRLALYSSAVLSQWLLAVVGLGVVYLIARKVFVQGFAAIPLSLTLEWSGAIAAPAILALSLVILCNGADGCRANPTWFTC